MPSHIYVNSTKIALVDTADSYERRCRAFKMYARLMIVVIFLLLVIGFRRDLNLGYSWEIQAITLAHGSDLREFPNVTFIISYLKTTVICLFLYAFFSPIALIGILWMIYSFLLAILELTTIYDISNNYSSVSGFTQEAHVRYTNVYKSLPFITTEANASEEVIHNSVLSVFVVILIMNLFCAAFLFCYVYVVRKFKRFRLAHKILVEAADREDLICVDGATVLSPGSSPRSPLI